MGGRFSSLAQVPVRRLAELELHTSGLDDGLVAEAVLADEDLGAERSRPPSPRPA
jgi:hypothetical protein